MGKRGPEKGFTFPKNIHNCPDCGQGPIESAHGNKLCDPCKAARKTARAKARWADPESRAAAQAATRDWQQRNRQYLTEKARARSAAQGRQGFSREFLDEQLALQAGLCALTGAGGCHGDLVVDHCHASGRFRGWLCRQHNAALGKLGDTSETIQLALDYLNGNRRRKT